MIAVIEFFIDIPKQWKKKGIISSFYPIRLQTHCLFYKSDLIINFLPTNSEKPCQFAFRHSNLSLSLTNNTHTIALLKKNSEVMSTKGTR